MTDKSCPYGCDKALTYAMDLRIDALTTAVWQYMSQFGQALDAHGIPYGPAQIEADRNLREVLELCKN